MQTDDTRTPSFLPTSDSRMMEAAQPPSVEALCPELETRATVDDSGRQADASHTAEGLELESLVRTPDELEAVTIADDGQLGLTVAGDQLALEGLAPAPNVPAELKEWRA